MTTKYEEAVAAGKRPLSVSQRNTYDRCSYAWYLGRRMKVWQKPAAWLPMGSAVHEALEMWEKSERTMSLEEAQEIFRESYARECENYCETTPNFDWWFASGPYRAEDDIPRRFDLGHEHVERYINYALEHPNEKVWRTPVGPCQTHPWFDEDCEECLPVLATELEFQIMAGDVPVRGFIDLVVEVDHPTITDKRCAGLKANAGKSFGDEGFIHSKMSKGCTCREGWSEVVVRDHKTGNTPGDDFQLGVYGLALQEMFGIEAPEAGDYFMTKAGKPTFPYDISKWTKERVAEEFARVEEGIASGEFPPDPAPDKCKFCDVALSCEFRMA